jgi:hypothetical protein
VREVLKYELNDLVHSFYKNFEIINDLAA